MTRGRVTPLQVTSVDCHLAPNPSPAGERGTGYLPLSPPGEGTRASKLGRRAVADAELLPLVGNYVGRPHAEPLDPRQVGRVDQRLRPRGIDLVPVQV